MSIFCSTFSIGCDWGGNCIRRAPVAYRGSHILPTEKSERGGSIDLAAIPGYIRRPKNDNRPMHPYRPWLRVSVAGVTPDATVLLDRRQAARLRDELTIWLELSDPKYKAARERGVSARKGKR